SSSATASCSATSCRAEVARRAVLGQGVQGDVRGVHEKVHNGGSPSAKMSRGGLTSGSSGTSRNKDAHRVVLPSTVAVPPAIRTLPPGKAPWHEYVIAPNGTTRISSGCTWKTSVGTSC